MPTGPRVPASSPVEGSVAHDHRKVARVAAFGDSLMWGQGLRRSETFATLINNALPAILGKTSSGIVFDESRSGAMIEARGDGRAKFIDTFPHLFADATARSAFLDASSDKPATELYGEIPAAFPSVRGQVRLLSNEVGQTVDVALVDGGVNDIEVEDIINPSIASGKFIERWDGQIRSVAHDDVLVLLTRVRRKCPNAVILYFGFFAPLSYGSHVSKIREAFKHQLDDDFAWWVNDVFDIEDVNAAIRQAQTRSTWFQGRWQYWTRRAVTEANGDAALRGPGILFVPSGFGEPNSVFGDKPFLHEDYTDPTTDAARVRRMRGCPRLQQFAAMQKMYQQARDVTNGSRFATLPTKDDVRALRDAIDGPERLRAAQQEYIDDVSRDTVERMGELLHKEVLRIGRALIASMSHPNAAGAKFYAHQATERLKRHVKVTEAITHDERPGAPGPLPGTVTLESQLKRYKLRGTGSLHAHAGHHHVDSLAVQVVTSDNSDRDFSADVWLVVSTKKPDGTQARSDYRLNFPYRRTRTPTEGFSMAKLYPHFEPGTKNNFTVDTMGRLRLEEIEGSRIVVGPDPLAGIVNIAGKFWRPETVMLEVNGVRVLSLDLNGRQLSFNDSLDLSYPGPHPNTAPPRLPVVQFEMVEPLHGTRGTNGASTLALHTGGLSTGTTS